MSRYLAAYDVSRDSRRQLIARVLFEYGFRVQLSVFEVDLEPDDLPEIRRRIGALLDGNDSFDLVPIDPDPRRARLSWQRRRPEAAVVAFI